MKKNVTLGLAFILALGLSITYAKNLAHAGEGGKVTDRVCTMQIDKDKAETLTKDGYTYYFCSNKCKATFAKNPAKYACVCPQLLEGCDCGHCAGEGVPCECAEAQAVSHSEKNDDVHGHGHMHEEEGHPH